MFDSLQLGTGAPAVITTIVGGEVTIVSFAAACSFFDESMLPRALPLLPRVPERRSGAAVKAAAAASQRSSYHPTARTPTARTSRPRITGDSGCAVPAVNTRASFDRFESAVGKKVCIGAVVFWPFLRA